MPKLIRTKAVAAKVLLQSGETIRSTANALGIDKGTVHALSKQQILSDAELDSLERIIREKALRKTEEAIDCITKTKLEKAKAHELASIAKQLRTLGEGEKDSTALRCNTLILTKYGRKDTPVIDNTPSDNTYDIEKINEINGVNVG